MSIQRINPGSLRRSPGLTRVVRVGDTVYISGLTAREGDSVVGVGDIDAQLDRVYGSIETALKEVGGGLDNLVKITAYTTRPEYYRGVVSARSRFLGAKPAASSTVIIPALGHPNILVEIEAIAVVGETGKLKESVNPPEMTTPEHHAMLVKVGDVVYICRLCAWDPAGNLIGVGDPAAQAAQLYKNMDICLSSVGAGRADVVKTTTFYTHPLYYDAPRTAREAYYHPNPPTSASVVVSHLANPDAVLEIEAIAVIGGRKRHLNPDKMHQPTGFTNVVQAGDTVYISGQVGVDSSGALTSKGDPDGQLRQLYANLDAALESVGGTRSSMVKTTTYCTRTEYLSSVRSAREEFYGDNPPTSAAIPVQGLANPDMLVEIEAIAFTGGR